MFHSSSVREPARKSERGMHLPFHLEHGRLAQETCRSEICGYEVTGMPKIFLKVKDQLLETRASFNT